MPYLYRTKLNTRLYSYAADRSRWSCRLWQRYETAWLLGMRVRIPLSAWMFVSCIYCVLC